MNHKNMTFALAAIVAVVAVTSVGFVVPQQVLAYHHHHSHDNGIRVNQNISQANLCSDQTVCVNDGNNSLDVDK
jgi:hypothetical protein